LARRIAVIADARTPALGRHVESSAALLEGFDLGGMGLNAPPALHLMGRRMNLAYLECNACLGPRFVAMPWRKLLQLRYRLPQRPAIRASIRH